VIDYDKALLRAGELHLAGMSHLGSLAIAAIEAREAEYEAEDQAAGDGPGDRQQPRS